MGVGLAYLKDSFSSNVLQLLSLQTMVSECPFCVDGQSSQGLPSQVETFEFPSLPCC